MRRTLVFLLLSAACACAQTSAAHPAAPDAQQIVKQYGPAFELLPAFPVLAADLDGDGRQDAVVVATAKNPLLDQAEFHYKVVDPYNSAFGFGDPKVTATFSAEQGPARMLLVVSDWQAATPRARFVMINVPFEKLEIGRVLVKKKPVTAIGAEEMTGMISFVYWDGKKWKWKASDSLE